MGKNYEKDFISGDVSSNQYVYDSHYLLSSTYYLYSQWGGTWHDANKTYVDDSLMCWAASAANILDWGNWDAAGYNSETKIFEEIKAHWTNNAGYQNWAWQWWLNGTPPPYNIYSHIEVSGGWNFYPTEDFYNYYRTASRAGEIATMAGLMSRGYGHKLGDRLVNRGHPRHYRLGV
jgi:hypothetical protein